MKYSSRLLFLLCALTFAFSGCTTTSTNDYNLCALGAGAAGLGVGLASGGTGAVVLATGAGAGLGYMICQEEVPAPVADPVVDETVPAMVETDGDGDGVPDHRDDCPNTAPGVRVDDRGCALPLILDSATLNFAFDSAILPDNAADSLKAFVEYVKRYPGATFEVAGHADSTGPEGYNQGLSERRAAAVAGYLESRGIPPGQLRIVGYGEMEPIASNETEAGRARNRRVEVRVIDDGSAERSPDDAESTTLATVSVGSAHGQLQGSDLAPVSDTWIPAPAGPASGMGLATQSPPMGLPLPDGAGVVGSFWVHQTPWPETPVLGSRARSRS